MVDLRTLEYPRMLHKGPDTNHRVEDAEHAAREMAEGWLLEVDMHYGEVQAAAVAEIEPEAPAPEPEPVKRGPGRPRKQP